VPISIVASAPLIDSEKLLPGKRPISDTNRANLLWIMLDKQERLVMSLLPPRRFGLSPTKVGTFATSRLQRLQISLPSNGPTHGKAMSSLPGPHYRASHRWLTHLLDWRLFRAGHSPRADDRSRTRSAADGAKKQSVPFQSIRAIRLRTVLPGVLRNITYPLARTQ
jgi:hypothetical protein